MSDKIYHVGDGYTNGLEIINVLNNNEDQFLLLRVPDQDTHYIYRNGKKFATFENGIDALIVHDMLVLHFDKYTHLYKGEET